MKKLFTGIIIAIVLLLLISGGVVFFMFNKTASGGVETTQSTSQDGAVSMTSQFYDLGSGSSDGTVTQALIAGINKKTHVAFSLRATNTGNVPLINVRPTQSNANLGTAFNNTSPLALLSVGASGILVGTTAQSCSLNSICDSNEQCCDPTKTIAEGACQDGIGTNKICLISLDNFASGTTQHNVDFSVKLTGDFLNAQNQTQSTTSSAVVLTYDVRAEKCADGTTINTCVFARTGVDSDKPMYCNFVEGTLPSLINKATLCGCPAGFQANGDSCQRLTCTVDGETWNVNTCSTTAHEGTFGAKLFCKTDQIAEARCNQCGATNDVYGNAKIGCSSGSDPSSAVYQNYAGSLNVSLGES